MSRAPSQPDLLRSLLTWGPLEAHTLACHVSSPGLWGDNADQSLKEILRLLTLDNTIG